MRKQTHLLQLGLNEKTERVYRALLSLADAPASLIARRAGVKRTSIYHLLESLVTMGLATSYREGGVQRFVAEHPAKLKTFFERQMILAERLIPELTEEIRKTPSPTWVQVFEGRDGVRSLSEEALQTKQKKILSIGSSQKLLELLGGKYGFGKRRRERGIFHRALRLADDEFIDTPERLHHVKFLPRPFVFPAYLLLWDNTVALIPMDQPPHGIKITNRPLATAMKALFEILWEAAG